MTKTIARAAGWLVHAACCLAMPVGILSLVACNDATEDGRHTHVVCHSGGVRILDDFGKYPHLSEGGISYVSDTTHARTRVTGDCAAFKDGVPGGWKALLPGMNKDIQQ